MNSPMMGTGVPAVFLSLLSLLVLLKEETDLWASGQWQSRESLATLPQLLISCFIKYKTLKPLHMLPYSLVPHP